jgi:uncharacterized protein YuzE
MKFHYYQDTDSLYIELLPKASVDSNEVSPGVVIDLDAEGHLVGIDVEHASKNVDLTRLEAESLPFVSVSVA